ncbi:hypothetical protein [Amycolatopsis suaedae]|uniref:Uncharacterized protein n=1 Tax=Amycolatopsis suaedae TaxID=2510978 RepID=A0A4Q7J8W0_9PSEU|nr:hypothetical protein [Amycolatopsis suaedae]RZQ64160.1 hypothetical protein EWH70_09195 [Amycolatopsis suaedae]
MSSDDRMSVLLGTKLAKTVGGQLAVDLPALVVLTVLLQFLVTGNPLISYGLPAVVLVIAVGRAAIVASRRRL